MNQTCVFSTDTGGSGTPDVQYQNFDNSAVVGSGLIDPFLTVQNDPTESGFSTDVANPSLPLDTKRAGGNEFTRTFTIDDLFAVTIGGVSYYRFFLDINEPSGTKSPISLDYLKIYDIGSQAAPGNTITSLTGGAGSLESYATANGWATVYNLDDGGDNTLGLDYDVFGSGSGKGIDLGVLIPTSFFSGSSTDRIVFATAFGGADPSQDGFEEWWAQTRGTPPEVCPPGTIGSPPNCVIPPVTIPEPGSVALVGLGLAGLAAMRRRLSA